MNKIILALLFSLSLTFNSQVYSLDKITKAVKKTIGSSLIKHNPGAENNTLKKPNYLKKLARFMSGYYVVGLVITQASRGKSLPEPD